MRLIEQAYFLFWFFFIYNRFSNNYFIFLLVFIFFIVVIFVPILIILSVGNLFLFVFDRRYIFFNRLQPFDKRWSLFEPKLICIPISIIIIRQLLDHPLYESAIVAESTFTVIGGRGNDPVDYDSGQGYEGRRLVVLSDVRVSPACHTSARVACTVSELNPSV